MRLPLAMLKASMNLLISTTVFVVAYGFYSCWFAWSSLARGREVASSLLVNPDKVKADAALANAGASELSSRKGSNPVA